MDVAILTRVSKESQSYERQINDLRSYANSRNYNIVGEFNEKVSGITKNQERTALLELEELIETQKIDKILVWELSRLGRSTLQVLKSLEKFHSKNISLFVLNYNIETLDSDGKVNPMAQLLITMLAEFSRTERIAIHQRLESGYKKYRADGGKVGRKSGYKKDKDVILEQYKDVTKLLKQGYSIRKIMKLTDRSNGTVQKVKKMMV